MDFFFGGGGDILPPSLCLPLPFTLVSCSAYLTLEVPEMEMISSSNMSVDFQQTSQYYIQNIVLFTATVGRT
jgi:hypothetical protein